MNYFSLYLKGLICFCLLFITMDSTYISKDRLIMDISYDTIVLKYQGKEVYLCKNDYNKCDELKKEIFGE